jgi:hypothetical protein
MKKEFSVSATWTIRIDGDCAYVKENFGDMVISEHGPMPRDAVGPFLDEAAENIGHHLRRSVQNRIN